MLPRRRRASARPCARPRTRRARARAPASPSAAPARGRPAAAELARHAVDIPGLDERAGYAVLDHLGDGADARSRRSAARPASPRAGRFRSPPSATCGRRRLRARASRGSRCGRGARRRPSSPSSPASARVSASSGPLPRIASRACRLRCLHAREGAQERRVVLLLDQAADGERERRVRWDPGLGRRRRRGRSGQLVEAVPDRHQLAGSCPAASRKRRTASEIAISRRARRAKPRST